MPDTRCIALAGITSATPHASITVWMPVCLSARNALTDADANDTSGEPVSMMNSTMPSDQTSAVFGSYGPPATISGAM
ncbi:unnamed protein product [Phytophthora fragariaefolia]|uniref:Unnamed protein product n=1 Tax=Phytophthora fragariaefolia TaxID=1490495 RepID=A0A9W6YMB4_9STRA|nr:unnamed protein product [Phytophthora fragariaefolia]